MKNYLIYFIIVFGVTSCTTERKAIKFLDKHPLVAADYCATKYPVKESVITEIKYVPADNKDYTNQINQAVNDRDSALTELEKLKEIAAKDKSGNCTHYQMQIPKLENTIAKLSATIQRLNNEYEKCKYDTVKTTITKIQEEQAKYSDLTIRYNDLDKQYAIQGDKLIREQKSSNSWMWRFIGLAGLVWVYVLLRVRKLIPF